MTGSRLPLSSSVAARRTRRPCAPPPGALADQHRARLGRLLESRGDVDRIARHEELAAGRAPTGARTSPVLTPMRTPRRTPWRASKSALSALELGEHLARPRCSARTGSSSRATGTPKTARIASPMYFSTVPPHVLDDARHRGEVLRQQRAQPLGVELLAEVGRADHVGEKDRGELAFLGAVRRARAAFRSSRRTLRRPRQECRRTARLSLVTQTRDSDAAAMGAARPLNSRSSRALCPGTGIRRTISNASAARLCASAEFASSTCQRSASVTARSSGVLSGR